MTKTQREQLKQIKLKAQASLANYYSQAPSGLVQQGINGRGQSILPATSTPATASVAAKSEKTVKLEEAYKSAVDARDQAYWLFYRCKRSNPDRMMQLAQVVAETKTAFKSSFLDDKLGLSK